MRKASGALTVLAVVFVALLVMVGYTSASPVHLTFWFYVAGPNFENVKNLVEEFNRENEDIQVETVLETGWKQKLPVTVAAAFSGCRVDGLDVSRGLCSTGCDRQSPRGDETRRQAGSLQP